MNEFPEGHVKVPSWELFILHIAVRFWTAIVFKNTSYHILHAGRKQPFASTFLCTKQKNRGTVTEIYYRYSVSVFSCFVIWPEGLFRLSDPWQARNFWQCAKWTIPKKVLEHGRYLATVFWSVMYRCQCEVARACLRGIRSFAHSKTSLHLLTSSVQSHGL